MYYHASQTPDLKVLKPNVSNHNKSLVYFSKKRENVLVYLSNAIEKYCKEVGFEYSGVYHKWASYGFNKDGILKLQEYYPNATYDTYKGVSGYIYSSEDVKDIESKIEIPDVVVCKNQVQISKCEFISDAYTAIMEAVEDGKIELIRYEDNSEEMINWIEKTIKSEYINSINQPEYRIFLKEKFNFLK